jgi:HAD superfamily hydrolase (TIGR01549 family)
MLIGFDFDGVLIDSLDAMQYAWSDTTQALNCGEVDFLRYKPHIGKPFPVIMDILNLYDKMPQIQEYYFKNTSKYVDNIKSYGLLIDYINYIHDNRKSNSRLKTSIITSKPLESTKKLVDKFAIRTDLIVTPEKVSRGKPFPDSLEYASIELGQQVDKCIYVGDMLSDLECAESAGWQFIFANWGYGSVADVTSKITMRQSASPEECISILQSWVLSNGRFD